MIESLPLRGCKLKLYLVSVWKWLCMLITALKRKKLHDGLLQRCVQIFRGKRPILMRNVLATYLQVCLESEPWKTVRHELIFEYNETSSRPSLAAGRCRATCGLAVLLVVVVFFPEECVLLWSSLLSRHAYYPWPIEGGREPTNMVGFFLFFISTPAAASDTSLLVIFRTAVTKKDRAECDCEAELSSPPPPRYLDSVQLAWAASFGWPQEYFFTPQSDLPPTLSSFGIPKRTFYQQNGQLLNSRPQARLDWVQVPATRSVSELLNLLFSNLSNPNVLCNWLIQALTCLCCVSKYFWYFKKL